MEVQKCLIAVPLNMRYTLDRLYKGFSLLFVPYQINNRYITSSCILVIVLHVTPALSQCNLQKKFLVGNWVGNSVDVANGGWIQCNLTVKTDLKLQRETSCRTSIGGGRVFITSGSLSIDNFCNVTGSISLNIGLTSNMLFGSMSADKSYIAGVGKGNFGSLPFFSILRK
jgi:hypothetical protein